MQLMQKKNNNLVLKECLGSIFCRRPESKYGFIVQGITVTNFQTYHKQYVNICKYNINL